MSINDAMRALVAEMIADDVPDPLAQPLTLVVVWADLARIVGQQMPAEVVALIDAPVPLRPIRSVPKVAPSRGSSGSV
jgi:hypothetical protein